MEQEEIREYFGCSCLDLYHILFFHYYFPTEKEKEDNNFEDVIYLALFANQWRNQILPEFWSKYFWTEDIYKKQHWQFFYERSLYKRIIIGIKYFFRYKKIEDSIFDSVIVRKSDKERLLKVLSVFDQKQTTTETKLRIKNDEYCLEFTDNEEERKKFPGLNELICTGFQFKEFRSSEGKKKFMSVLKYILYRTNEEVHFEIKPHDAIVLKNLIKKAEKS